MTLSIITKGSAAPAYAPVFGNLVHTGNLKFAVRANSKNNFFDLSDEEHTLNVLPDTKMLLANKGIDIFGGGNAGTSQGIQALGLLATQVSDYTILGVIASPKIAVSDQTTNLWLLGDFVATASYSGLGLFLRSTVNGDGTYNITLRGCFGGRHKTTGVNGGAFVDVAYLQNIPSLSNNDVKPMFVVARQRIAGGTTYMDVKILSSNLENSNTNTNYDMSGAGKAQILSDLGITPRPLKIGGCYAASASDDSIFRSINIKECRFDGVALTDQQIEDQYQATKKWLLAEGAIDISHWR